MQESKQAAKFDIPLREENHPKAYFHEEVDGWHGYIEWEKYPEKKAEAANILSQYSFADVKDIPLFVIPSIALDNTLAHIASRISIAGFAKNQSCA